jgi:hypothetical protein
VITAPRIQETKYCGKRIEKENKLYGGKTKMEDYNFDVDEKISMMMGTDSSDEDEE